MEPLNTGDGPAISESSPPGQSGIFLRLVFQSIGFIWERKLFCLSFTKIAHTVFLCVCS